MKEKQSITPHDSAVPKSAPHDSDSAQSPAQSSAQSSFRAYATPLVEEAAAHSALLQDSADAEILHKLRVVLRRLNTLLWAYQPLLEKSFYDEQRALCRYLAHAAGDTRDWDVLIAVLTELDMPAAANSLGVVRNETLKRSKETLSNAGVEGLLRDEITEVNRGLNTSAAAMPLSEFASRSVSRAQAQLKKRIKAAAKSKSGDYASLHAVRKAGKKVRYLIEFFAPLLNGDVKKQVRGVKRLLKRFGLLNDVVASRSVLLSTAHLPLTGKEIRAALKTLKKEQRMRAIKVEKLL